MNENYKFINAELEEKDSDSVLAFYRKLSELRKVYNSLIFGDYREIFSDNEEFFAFERSLNNEKLTTVVNFSLNPVKIPDEITRRKLILSSERIFETSELKPLEARIYKNN